MGGSSLKPILLDTHIWFWYLSGSDRLPSPARALLDQQAGEGFISPISVWELGMLHEERRIELEGSFEGWLTEAYQAYPLREAPLTREVARISLRLDLPHRDPAARFLAATALVYDLALVTADEKLLEAGSVPTVTLR